MGCQASTAAFEKRELKTHISRIEECYNIQQRLGEGNCAVVRACTSKKSQSALAVKIVKQAEEKQARRELEVWRKVGNHDNIVPLVEEFIEGGTYYFIMPRCQCSITEKFKTAHNKSTPNNMLDAFHQVFLGLQHCHSVDVIHRDMKAANLLVDFSGKVRIADFGLSICNVAGGHTGLAGSIPYMSPEMVSQQCYGLETDIWSCGVAIYTLFYGKYPYEAMSYHSTEERQNLILEAIRENSRVPDYEPVDGKPVPSASVRALVKKLLERNAQLRPDAFVCSKLSLAAKSPIEPETPAFVKPTALKEDKAEASWSTACPTDADANSSRSWINLPSNIWSSEKSASGAMRGSGPRGSSKWASEKSASAALSGSRSTGRLDPTTPIALRSTASDKWASVQTSRSTGRLDATTSIALRSTASDKWASVQTSSTAGRVIIGGGVNV